MSGAAAAPAAGSIDIKSSKAAAIAERG